MTIIGRTPKKIKLVWQYFQTLAEVKIIKKILIVINIFDYELVLPSNNMLFLLPVLLLVTIAGTVIVVDGSFVGTLIFVTLIKILLEKSGI